MSAPVVRYKVIETSVVTDEALEAIVNEWVGRGWAFDGMQFAMRESSKRPAMAFLLFTTNTDDARTPAAAPTIDTNDSTDD